MIRIRNRKDIPEGLSSLTIRRDGLIEIREPEGVEVINNTYEKLTAHPGVHYIVVEDGKDKYPIDILEFEKTYTEIEPGKYQKKTYTEVWPCEEFEDDIALITREGVEVLRIEDDLYKNSAVAIDSEGSPYFFNMERLNSTHSIVEK